MSLGFTCGSVPSNQHSNSRDNSNSHTRTEGNCELLMWISRSWKAFTKTGQLLLTCRCNCHPCWFPGSLLGGSPLVSERPFRFIVFLKSTFLSGTGCWQAGSVAPPRLEWGDAESDWILHKCEHHLLKRLPHHQSLLAVPTSVVGNLVDRRGQLWWQSYIYQISPQNC